MQRRTMTPDALEHIAENMKERIYATITLLAVIAAQWQTAEHHSVRGTVVTVAGAVIALWLATLIAARMSYRAVHGKSMDLHEYRRIIFTSSGLLAPAIVPIIILLFSLTGMYTLSTALFASMIVLLFSLFLLSYTAGRRIYTSTIRLIFVSLLEMSLGIGVILLKLLLGE